MAAAAILDFCYSDFPNFNKTTNIIYRKTASNLFNVV